MKPDGSLEDPGWRNLAIIPATIKRFCSRSDAFGRCKLSTATAGPAGKAPSQYLTAVASNFGHRESQMSFMSLLLNILWIAFGGLWMSVAWIVAAVIMAITIIGLPWARAAINIGLYTLLPFGQKAVSRAEYSGVEDVGSGLLGFIGNLIWLVLAGWWLALGHVLTAILLAVTIIGIPFAWAHLKLAGIALWPIGKMIVPAADANLYYSRRSAPP